MSRNGSGIYSLPGGVNPVTAGSLITDTWANTTLNDIAAQITNSLAADGQTTPSADIPLGGHKLTGVALASVLGDALAYGRAATLTDLTTTGSTVLGDSSSDTLNVGNGGLVKDASGNVLIGTTTALQGNAGRGLLEINGSSDTLIAFKKANAGQGFLFFDSSGNGNLVVSGAFALNLATSGVNRLQITPAGVIQDGSSNELGFKGLPAASVTTGAFVAADRGKCVNATGGVTVPNSTMSATDVVYIDNQSGGAITITATITTLKLAGTTSTGNRTLAADGFATVRFRSGTVAVISGPGVS